MAALARQSQPRRRLGVLLTAAVLAVASLVVVIDGTRHLLRWLSAPEPRLSAPVETTVELSAGLHAVYVEPSADAAPVVSLDSIDVAGPDGEEITVTPPGSLGDDHTIDSTTFEGVARFEAPVDGLYDVRVDSERPTEVVIAWTTGEFARSVGFWAALVPISGLLFLAAVAVAGLGLLRGRQPAASPP